MSSVHTISLWAWERLAELQRLRPGDIEALLYDSPAVLSFPILQHCLRSEQLLIPVDPHMDIFLAHLPQYHATVALEISVQLMVPANSRSGPWSLLGLHMLGETRETGQG